MGRVLKENVEAVLSFLQSPAARAKALSSSDGETVYRALWAHAYEDAVATVPLCRNLLSSKSDEVRFAAVWMLTLLGLKEASQAKAMALKDSNLQVAMMAAASTAGTSLNEENSEAVHANEPDDDAQTVATSGTFEALEDLYRRLPEKPQTLKPIVWPWTERKIERSMIADALLGELGDLPPTRMLPYMKGLNTWAQRSIIEQLAAQKKWDALTRSTLFDLVGHKKPRLSSTSSLPKRPVRATKKHSAAPQSRSDGMLVAWDASPRSVVRRIAPLLRP